MKKQVFFAICVMVTLLTSAQRAVISPVSQDSVRSFYMTSWVGVSVPVTYTQHCIYQKVGDTIMSTTPTVAPTTMSYLVTISNLVPNTSYQFANVIFAGGVHDTSAFETFTTPVLQPLSITNITVDTSVFPVKTRLHFDFGGGYSTKISVIVNGSPLNQTSSIQLIGSGDTAVTMTGYSTRGAMYTSNFVYAAVVGSVPGISPDSFFTCPNYTVPSSQGPSGASTTVQQFQDSLVFTTTVSMGNASSMVLTRTLHDSATNLPPTRIRTMYHDTTFSDHYTNQFTNDAFWYNVQAVSTAGLDSESISAHTLPINKPTLTSNFGVLDQTTSSVKVFITGNTNGTWTGSPSKNSVVYTNKTGSVITLTGSIYTGVQTDSFTLTNLNPGTQGTCLARVTNNLGMRDSLLIGYITLSPRQAPAPTWGNIVMVNASTLQVNNLHQVVDANDTVGDGFVVQNLTSGGVDTFFTSGGLTQTQTLASSQFTGLIGGTTYEVTPFSISADGVYTFGTSLQQYTDAPSNPVVEDIIVDTTGNRVKITIRANGQGTPSQLFFEVDNTSGGAVHTYVAIPFGTGYVSYDFYPDQYLAANTWYYASATVTDMNNDNPNQMGQDFMTPAMVTTGISNVSPTANAITVYPNPTTDFVHGELGTDVQATINVFDLSGKLVGTTPASQSFTLDMREMLVGEYVFQILDQTNTVLSTNRVVKK